MGAEALTARMADYFRGMLTILEAHGATVDKSISDAIVGYWCRHDGKSSGTIAGSAVAEVAFRSLFGGRHRPSVPSGSSDRTVSMPSSREEASGRSLTMIRPQTRGSASL
jgi:hypothetical protein